MRFPMVAGITHSICRAYGIEHPEAGVALRASFLLEQHGEVCPAGWSKGQAGMKADAEGVAGYLDQFAETL